MDVKIEASWRDFLADEFRKEYFYRLVEKVKELYKNAIVFPPAKYIFRAFDLVPLNSLKVVVLGQDPYHTPGVADGLAFSSMPNNPIPPSLQNIFKEIENDMGYTPYSNPDLSRWAKQGVLLLNTTLTVEKSKPYSHKGIGWEIFTDSVISRVSSYLNNIVFILWGSHARQKKVLIDISKHLIIESAHPSPFSAEKGFFGSRPFSKTNQYLIEHDKNEIDWR